LLDYIQTKEAVMKSKIRTLIIVLLSVMLLLVTTIPASAHTRRTPFNGTELWVEDLSLGEETYPAEGLYNVRGAVSLFSMTTSDPRVGGEDLITVNWNFKLVDPPVYVTGPMWGTFRISNAGGAWEGSFVGVRNKQGASYIYYIGKGTGGYKGLLLTLSIVRIDPDPSTTETVTGYIY
jgi:hypothetical protein